MYVHLSHVEASLTDTMQDLDTSISDLATKFMKTDIKNLEDELAHHELQSRFDAKATAKLHEWEKLVCSLLQSAFLTNSL